MGDEVAVPGKAQPTQAPEFQKDSGLEWINEVTSVLHLANEAVDFGDPFYST